MKTKTVLLFLIVLFSGICRIHAQADFYLMQALGSRYIYNSDYFEETREMQVYLSGVDGSLKNDVSPFSAGNGSATLSAGIV